MNRQLGEFCLTNFHSHTVRCGHASGTEEQYILQAIDTGFDCLGFAEHSAWPYKSNFVSDMRMRVDQLDGYISTLRALGRKYSGQLRLYVGMECEAFPEFYSWLRDLRAEKGLDYYILGNHYDTSDERGGMYFGYCYHPEDIKRYLVTTLNGMESGLFAYLAHPDLFLRSYPTFDATAKDVSRELCRAAKALNLPLEYNLLGMSRNFSDRRAGGLGYTTDEFWDVAAETGNRAIIGVDAHSPEALDCAALIGEARRRLSERGIHIEDTLDGLEDVPCLNSAIEVY